MCTRFVFNGTDTLNGFNFEIDLADWTHTILQEKDRFGIGIQRPDGAFHMYHGVHSGGHVGTLLYVHGHERAAYDDGADCCTIADLTERFIKNDLTFDQAVRIAQTKRIVYAPDATMQAMLSDANGRVLIVEPGIGYRVERQRVSLMANGSLLAPESTQPFLTPGDDRYERAQALLAKLADDATEEDALGILQAVSQRGLWATRVSFVYAQRTKTVLFCENSAFDNVHSVTLQA